MSTDPRIDAYIDKSAGFARPILQHLRRIVQHAAFWFWQWNLMEDPKGYLVKTGSAMGNFGRITSLSDLPSKSVITGFIKQAMKINASRKTSAPAKRKSTPAPRIPADLMKAMRANRNVLATFTALTPGHKREYVGWITEAKRPETRAHRIATAIGWLAEGKKHNWKYAR